MNRPVVLISPRRVGKTVMLMHAAQKLVNSRTEPNHILYASLETPIYKGHSLANIPSFFPEQLGQTRSQRLDRFIDEIQYARGWEVQLK